MSNQLASLRDITTVVADTGDIDAIKKYQPVDATTNPSLLLKAAGLPQYASLIDDAVAWAKLQSNDADQQLTDAADKLAVAIGKEISATIPGRISTEVDARLSSTLPPLSKKRNVWFSYMKMRVSISHAFLLKLRLLGKVFRQQKS